MEDDSDESDDAAEFQSDADAGESSSDDDARCDTCGSRDDAHVMLLCDGCPGARHLRCCVPPLTRVPEGAWYCGACRESCAPAGVAAAFASATDADDVCISVRRENPKRHGSQSHAT